MVQIIGEVPHQNNIKVVQIVLVVLRGVLYPEVHINGFEKKKGMVLLVSWHAHRNTIPIGMFYLQARDNVGHHTTLCYASLCCLLLT